MDAAPPQHKSFPTDVTGAPPAMAPIVIVDDDDASRLLIEASLSALRLANPVVMACDGDDAVRQLQPCLRNEAPVPVLVMLDGRMPGRSGLEVLRWMREQPALRGVPVIMLTGVSDVDSIQDAYSSGAASYLVKPVAFGALADFARPAVGCEPRLLRILKLAGPVRSGMQSAAGGNMGPVEIRTPDG